MESGDAEFWRGVLTAEDAQGTSWRRDGREVCFVSVCVKTTERIVVDETGTYVVQSARRVPQEQ